MSKQVQEKLQNEGVVASFDLDTRSGKIKLANARGTGSISLKEVESETVIKVADVLLIQDTINQYGSNQEVTITNLYTEDGTLYSSISETVKTIALELVDFLNEDDEPLDVRVVRGMSKQGQEYLSLVILG